MKIDLRVMKEVLMSEEWDGGILDVERREWIKNNISEEEVGIKEFLSEFNKYWAEWSDDYGDSDYIAEMLYEDYNMEDEEVEEIMDVYWEEN